MTETEDFPASQPDTLTASPADTLQRRASPPLASVHAINSQRVRTSARLLLTARLWKWIVRSSAGTCQTSWHSTSASRFGNRPMASQDRGGRDSANGLFGRDAEPRAPPGTTDKPLRSQTPTTFFLIKVELGQQSSAISNSLETAPLRYVHWPRHGSVSSRAGDRSTQTSRAS